MKTAKIMVRTISLICPECQAVVTNSRGGEVIHDDAAERWEQFAQQPMQCSNCGKSFRLPANPFQTKRGS